MNSCHIHGTSANFKTMVSEHFLPTPNPCTSKMHQFFMSNSQFGATQNQHQHFDAYDPMPPLQMHMMQDPPISEGLMDFLGAPNRADFQASRRLSLSLGYMVPANLFGSSSSSATSYGSEALALPTTHSKFLRPAQWLLDEVVNVGSEAIDLSNQKFARSLSRTSKRGSLKLRLDSDPFVGKHELHCRLVKLISMLEEVERKYEKYYNQVEKMVSAFEMVAGLGAGKSYTALALHTMSRHFSCLKDAIWSQIQATKRQIAQEMPRISSDLSQLVLFDQDGKHGANRMPLSSIGLIYSHKQPWRPIRGLPDSSVNVLRSWLFEHFLNPYPTEVEKLTLSSQTGLSKVQVSNWFINARVRLWKPMIEEMYKEEFADEANSGEGCADSTEELNNKEG